MITRLWCTNYLRASVWCYHGRY